MIYADRFLKRNNCILRNLNTNSQNTASNTWSSGSSSYGFYSITYETPLALNHLYYYKFIYKFTTTNQSPTWCRFYYSNGSSSVSEQISNPVANNEYTVSGIFTYTPRINAPNTYGTIYNGQSNAISGVTAYVKNVMVYDVTELFVFLKARNSVSNSNSALKTWCDNNLVHKPKGTDYNLSSVLNDTSQKVVISGGDIIANDFITPETMHSYTYSSAYNTNEYFDSAASATVYNNSGGGTVAHTRVTDTTSPFYPEHKYVLKITTNGTASPGAGGFYLGHTAAANKVFVEKFIAKVPIGYDVSVAYNSQGNGSSVQLLGNAAGTGKYEEYTILYKCGSSGTFSTGGHVYLNGSNNKSVIWYVAYANTFNITGKEYLKCFTPLPNKNTIKGPYIFAKKFDTLNLFLNGRCAVQAANMLPTGWIYDTTDVAGSAKASIVQPVNVSWGRIGPFYINPLVRYKLSLYIKCKQDMTNFLTAFMYYTNNDTALTHNNVQYISGTKTYLTKALNPGDTTVTVASNANWRTYAYSYLGFRNYYRSYNDIYCARWTKPVDGIVAGVTGSNIINLRGAYTGTTIANGTYITEGYDSSTYVYPITKAMLSTDNTWKQITVYFGTKDTLFDGNSSLGDWACIPYDTVKMYFAPNIYTNTGTVPIKYADIRIEPYEGSTLHRFEKKICFGS